MSKATAVPLAKAAARIMLGETIAQLRAEGLLPQSGDGGDLPLDAPIAVKEAVLPFHRFRGPDGTRVDSLLGPEMKSTGEVMGFDAAFGTAFAKSPGGGLRTAADVKGTVFVSVANRDKRAADLPGQAPVRSRLPGAGNRGHGTSLATQRGPCPDRRQVLRWPGQCRGGDLGGECGPGPQHSMGLRGQLGAARRRLRDPYRCRCRWHSCLTTVQAAAAAVQGIEELIRGEVGVRSLQDSAR